MAQVDSWFNPLQQWELCSREHDDSAMNERDMPDDPWYTTIVCNYSALSKVHQCRLGIRAYLKHLGSAADVHCVFKSLESHLMQMLVVATPILGCCQVQRAVCKFIDLFK